MAPKRKSKSPKKSKMTSDLASDDLELLPENIPPENDPGNIPAVETSGEKSSSHTSGGPKPGPSKKALHGKRKRYVLNVSNTIYNVEQRINHFLKLQHEHRQEIYKEYSHQFLTLVVMWNIDVDQVKKHAKNLSNILDEEQKLFQQYQVIHKQKIEEFKELCNRHLKAN